MLATLYHYKQGVQSSAAKITQDYDEMRFILNLIHYFNLLLSVLIFFGPLRQCLEDIVTTAHSCTDLPALVSRKH